MDYFQKIPPNIENVAVSLSGGLDSGLALFCLAQELSRRRQYTTVIHPYHLFVSTLKYLDTRTNARDVVDYVRNKFPDVIIMDIAVHSGSKTPGDSSKMLLNIEALRSLCERVNIDWVIIGFTSGDYEVLNNHLPHIRDRELQIITDHADYFPWKNVDKYFIASEYNRLKILELSLITNSCVVDQQLGLPCKQCKWCRDRFAAFGNYDYGIT
jgi:7-cyano-7-deazaguanine synthase in queuosine biosynthesis